MARRSKQQVVADADPDTGHSIGFISNTPVLILAESLDRKWRVVAHMGSFIIYHRVQMAWRSGRDGAQLQQWCRWRRIARTKPVRGTASVAKLQDFTLQEHQAVINAMHSAMRRVGK